MEPVFAALMVFALVFDRDSCWDVWAVISICELKAQEISRR